MFCDNIISIQIAGYKQALVLETKISFKSGVPVLNVQQVLNRMRNVATMNQPLIVGFSITVKHLAQSSQADQCRSNPVTACL